ncbi:MAG: hypothetical protein JW814_00915 [Candidatus Krumholzibacteriota bacterium]|nr:hypothetical protein [Candidatus Krumholzibacteriota bacterium]
MKRLAILVIVLVLLSGCKSTLEVTNRSDPQDFPPIPFSGLGGDYYGEIVIDVPEEVRNDEFDITRADLYADIFADTIYASGDFEITVDFYIGLESGAEGIENAEINQYLTTVLITEQDQHNVVEIFNAELLHKGIKQEMFFLKALIEVETTEPVYGIIHLDDIYFIAYLERETEGLFPIFYLF